MSEQHIGPDGLLHRVVEPAEDTQYARELAQVRERLTAGPQGDELEELTWQENNLLLCLASLRWMRAMTQLQAEGVLGKGVGQPPVALGQSSYYADATRDNYYKVWRRDGQVVAVEKLALALPASSLGVAYLTLVPGGRWWLPGPAVPSLHRRDYANMALAVADYRRLIFTYDGPTPDDYLQVDTDAAGSWRYWGQSAAGPAHSAYVPARAPRLPEFTQCRVCCCTNEDCRQCIAASGQPCLWVAPYLCSRCHAEQQEGGTNG